MPVRVEAPRQVIQRKEAVGQQAPSVHLPKVEPDGIFSTVIQKAREQGKVNGEGGGNVAIDTPKLGGVVETPVWRKATASGTGNCVELGQFVNGMIGIGDTKSEKVFLMVSQDALAGLFTSIHHGKLN